MSVHRGVLHALSLGHSTLPAMTLAPRTGPTVSDQNQTAILKFEHTERRDGPFMAVYEGNSRVTDAKVKPYLENTYIEIYVFSMYFTMHIVMYIKSLLLLI